jgi:hypothetical protein
MKIFNTRNVSHLYAWIAHIFIYHISTLLFLDTFIENRLAKYTIIIVIFFNLVAGHSWGCSWSTNYSEASYFHKCDPFY